MQMQQQQQPTQQPLQTQTQQPPQGQQPSQTQQQQNQQQLLSAHPQVDQNQRNGMHIKRQEQRLLNAYVYDFLKRSGAIETAKAYLREGDFQSVVKNDGTTNSINGTGGSSSDNDNTSLPDVDVPVQAPEGFLYEWWTVFWDIYSAKLNRPGTADAQRYVVDQQMRNNRNQLNRMRLMQDSLNQIPSGVFPQNAHQNMQNGVSINVDANANGDMMSMSPQRVNQNQMKLNGNMIRQRVQGGMMNPPMQGIPTNRMFMNQNMLNQQTAAMVAQAQQNAQLPSQTQQPSTPQSQSQLFSGSGIRFNTANPSLKRNNEGVNQPISSPTKRARLASQNDSNSYLQNVQAQRPGGVNQQTQMPITQQPNSMILTTPVANTTITSPELKSNNNNNRQTPNLNGKPKNAPTPQMQMRQPPQVINNKSISPHGNPMQSLSVQNVQNSHDIQDPQLMNQVNLPNTNIHNNTLNTIPLQNAMNQNVIRPPNIPNANLMQNYGMGGMVTYPNLLRMQQAQSLGLRPNAPDAQKINPAFLNMDQNALDKYKQQNPKPTPSQTQPQPSGGSSIAVTNSQQMVVSNGQAQSQQPAQNSTSGIMPSSIISQQDPPSSLNVNMEEDLDNILGSSGGTNDGSIVLEDYLNFDLLDEPGPTNNAGPSAASNGN
ncbi:34804_t:CDS:10 [Gigaspora margarita]|uniref:34804_t:CDS:1 n=1 Tax=Gigaspora margarita TaxID=4874 RepID=A0ABN7UAU0_GIGMA|nr:34804_t:CDS:10 [Gigaspora margarita]